MTFPRLRLWLVAAGLLLAACSLAEDVTPPPDVLSSVGNAPAPGLTSESGLGYPVRPPSPAAGAAIFAQHCAACHGSTGKGDGAQSAQLLSQRAGPLPDLSTPDLVRTQAPAELYQVITQGRLDKLMPPWGDSLSETERWSVVAYLYTLSTSPDQLESGKALYSAQCADCHGQSGQGDGPQAGETRPPSFTDQAYMASTNQDSFLSAVADGKGEKMPGFEDKLTTDERWAVASYVRTLSFDVGGAGLAAPVTAEEQTGSIAGQVINGTQGAPVPPDQQVVLHGFDDFREVQVLTTTSRADGAFEFTDLPYLMGRQFMLTTLHDGLTYSSDIFSFAGSPQVKHLTLTIYDTTADPSTLEVERMHIFFDFNLGAGQVDIGEMLLISNHSDKTYAPSNGPIIEVPLPIGANAVNVQNRREGLDYTLTAQGLALHTPIRPGPNTAQISFSFQLPYSGSLDFEQTLSYPVKVLNVLSPEMGVTVQGGQLQDQGTQTQQGATFRAYGANGLPAKGPIAFKISGQPRAAQSSSARTSAIDPTSLVIGILALAVVVGGAGLGWYFWPFSRLAEPPSYEGLLQAIADLDDAFDEGQLERKRYERERARLKGKLLALVEKRGGQSPSQE